MMKRFRVCIMLLGLLLLGACAASDQAETGLPSGSEGTRHPKTGDVSQTDSKKQPEDRQLEEAGEKTADNPDQGEKEEESKPEASLQKPEESAPEKKQGSGSQKEEDSQVPAAASEPEQNESGKEAGEPETSVGEPAAQPVEETPAVTQPAEPEPVVPEEPVQPPAEPEKTKTIYDYAFDAGTIRAELIALGQSMGLTHITEDDGIPCTPDTCSWAAPVTASESFQGDNLERALKDYVTSMPSVIASYGGAQMDSFTIYVQNNGGGSYTFYFLY